MKNTHETINEICKKHGALGFFLGGSSSSGMTDEFSDRDYGVILEDMTLLDAFSMDLIKVFGEIMETVEKDLSTALHFMEGEERFEIRVVNYNSVVDALEKLEDNEILVYAEQDLLENIRRGIYFLETETLANIKKKIVYTDNLKKSIIARYFPLLDADEVRIPVLRGDKYLMMHYLVDLQRVSLVLAHAQAGKFTTSFKHEEKLMASFSETARFFFKRLDEMYCHPGEETFAAFETSLTKFQEELYHEINDIF